MSFEEIIKLAVQEVIREELRPIREALAKGQPSATQNDIGGIELAEDVTGYARATLYALCSDRKIPHSKRGNKLIFSRKKLEGWLTSQEREEAT